LAVGTTPKSRAEDILIILATVFVNFGQSITNSPFSFFSFFVQDEQSDFEI
jgi:hypothetical protein